MKKACTTRGAYSYGIAAKIGLGAIFYHHLNDLQTHSPHAHVYLHSIHFVSTCDHPLPRPSNTAKHVDVCQALHGRTLHVVHVV